MIACSSFLISFASVVDLTRKPMKIPINKTTIAITNNLVFFIFYLRSLQPL